VSRPHPQTLTFCYEAFLTRSGKSAESLGPSLWEVTGSWKQGPPVLGVLSSLLGCFPPALSCSLASKTRQYRDIFTCCTCMLRLQNNIGCIKKLSTHATCAQHARRFRCCLRRIRQLKKQTQASGCESEKRGTERVDTDADTRTRPFRYGS